MSKFECVCATIVFVAIYGGLALSGTLAEKQKTVRYTECVKYHQPKECQ
jgi:hypothetical protein